MRRLFLATYLWVLLLPWGFTSIGVVSNQLVLIANHDKFPVMLNSAAIQRSQPDADGLIDDRHCVMTSQTHLNFLADIFDLHDYIASIGDLFQFLGDWLWGFCPFIWGALVIRKLRYECPTQP